MNFLYLRISGENLSKDTINKSLELFPTSIDCEDIWQYKTVIDNDLQIEIELFSFIDMLFEHKELFRTTLANHCTELYIVLYPDRTQINISLPYDVLTKLHDMGINFNITIMSLEELYEKM